MSQSKPKDCSLFTRFCGFIKNRLALGLSGNRPHEFRAGDDKGTRHHEVRIKLALDTGQYDQEMAQEDAQDYARLLDMIITSAGPWPALSDWTTALAIQHETVPSGTTVPNAAGTVNDVFVESHIPGQVSVPEVDVPVMRVTLTVLFELEET